jgi:hypothetical protein
LTAANAAQEIHLPKAILRHYVALGLHHIFRGPCADVRDAPAVPLDGHITVQAIYNYGSVDLRQRAIDKPPDCGTSGNQEYQKYRK